jgi:hypothetical protein
VVGPCLSWVFRDRIELAAGPANVCCASDRYRSGKPLNPTRRATNGLMHRSERRTWRVSLFDDLVGEREQLIWDLEAERLGSPEIDD